MDAITKLLFPPSNREVGGGYPFRESVNSEKEFDRWVLEHNGVTNCLVSVYNLAFEICKIFYDFDFANSSELIYAKRLGSFLEHWEIPYVPLVTGKKGLHLHVLTVPQAYLNPRKMLTRATYWLIDMAGIFKLDEETKEYKIPLIDTQNVGDIRRLCRIPNTLRPPENKAYCTFLPPDWLDMSYAEIVKHSKTTHHYDYDVSGVYLTLNMMQNVDLDKYRPRNVISPSPPTDLPEDVLNYLGPMLRPCILKNVARTRPPHDIRTALVADLLTLDFTDAEILKICSGMGWEDYRQGITKYHITQLRRKNLRWYSCKRLRALGYCTGCLK